MAIATTTTDAMTMMRRRMVRTATSIVPLWIGQHLLVFAVFVVVVVVVVVVAVVVVFSSFHRTRDTETSTTTTTTATVRTRTPCTGSGWYVG